MKLPHPNKLSAFTLVEAMLGLFIITFLGMGLIKFLLITQSVSENNLYKSNALLAATNVLEQLKNKDSFDLQTHITDDAFNYKKSHSEEQTLTLGQPNALVIPIYSGNTSSTKDITINVEPLIVHNNSNGSFWLEVIYSYELPHNNRTHRSSVKFFRSSLYNL